MLDIGIVARSIHRRTTHLSHEDAQIDDDAIAMMFRDDKEHIGDSSWTQSRRSFPLILALYINSMSSIYNVSECRLKRPKHQIPRTPSFTGSARTPLQCPLADAACSRQQWRHLPVGVNARRSISAFYHHYYQHCAAVSMSMNIT